MNNKFDINISIAKDWTGSIMSKEDILNDYKSITPPKRRYLYHEAYKYIKSIDRMRKQYPDNHIFNNDFNVNIAILTVKLNVIAAENDVDPAVVFLVATDKTNK